MGRKRSPTGCAGAEPALCTTPPLGFLPVIAIVEGSHIVAEQPFYALGDKTGSIPVEISLQIIGLFSEGLYSNPNKAIEELVSNAFDADATTVHVNVDADLANSDSTIVVIDNGTGMDDEGLRIHWIVGDSIKRAARTTTKGRRTIGKFGIGKLAAYVLGERLTHISKVGRKYYSTTMDFSKIPKTASVTARPTSGKRAPVMLDVRELTAAQAKEAVGKWIIQDGGRSGLKLFGRGAEKSWTVAVISDLKDMAADLRHGQLTWILSTAMPMRDDFALYLNNKPVKSSKETRTRIGRWELGHEVTKLPKPAPDDLDTTVDSEFKPKDYRHWVLTDQLLGPITGYLEVYEEAIDTGKSGDIGRSNGFFVYVNGRLINPDDAGFGIDRNLLRHGTFSRFRAIINIDRLDDELRSSRETLRAGPRLSRSREILRGLFNFARSELEAHESDVSSERATVERVADSPYSLTIRPAVQLVVSSWSAGKPSRHFIVPSHDSFASEEDLRSAIEVRLAETEGLVDSVTYEPVGPFDAIARLNVLDGRLTLNLEHPFIAHFADEYGDTKKNLPLELLATAEVLLEAQLFDAGIDPEAASAVMDERDELLRHLARTSGAQSSHAVANRLLASVDKPKELESAVVEAFRQLGMEAVPYGNGDEPDGVAEAHLAADGDGPTRYRVSLEAKSKEKPGKRVANKDVRISTVARHRKNHRCDHAIVVGQAFSTGKDDDAAVIQEIDEDRENSKGKTITLMRVDDLARLVRLAPIKRLNLVELRELFTARSPDEASGWVDGIESRTVDTSPASVILEAVWELQKDDSTHKVEYGSLRTLLRREKSLKLDDANLKNECLALSRMAPNHFRATDDRVELRIHPDKVLDLVDNYLRVQTGDDE